MCVGTNQEPAFLQSAVSSYLYIDHQNMIFGGKYITLAWKHTYTDIDCNTYQIKLRYTCGYTSPIEHVWDTTSCNMTLNETSTSNNESHTDIDIQLVNHDGFICKVMKETVQVHTSGKVYFKI